MNRPKNGKKTDADMFHYLFNVDGQRITSIFDITVLNKVLIAGREKYNLAPLKVPGIEHYENKQDENKGVISTIKHACVGWLEKNSIPLDGEFRDVKISNKTVKMHLNRNHKQENRDLNYSIDEIRNKEANQNLDTSITDDVLVKIIEKIIDSEFKSKFEKQFYDSLKPSDSNQTTKGEY